MPNGDPAFDLRSLEDFFEPIRQGIERLARQHNLTLTNYYHEWPSWSLSFRHPKGGIAKLDVAKGDDLWDIFQQSTPEGVRALLDFSVSKRPDPDTCFITCEWWCDDYDRATRSIRWGPGERVRREAMAVEIALERQLRLVLSWSFGQWDEIHREAARRPPGVSREQFDASEKRYPEVKP